jgi:hypothetical protein
MYKGRIALFVTKMRNTILRMWVFDSATGGNSFFHEVFRGFWRCAFCPAGEWNGRWRMRGGFGGAFRRPMRITDSLWRDCRLCQAFASFWTNCPPRDPCGNVVRVHVAELADSVLIGVVSHCARRAVELIVRSRFGRLLVVRDALGLLVEHPHGSRGREVEPRSSGYNRMADSDPNAYCAFQTRPWSQKRHCG